MFSVRRTPAQTGEVRRLGLGWELSVRRPSRHPLVRRSSCSNGTEHMFGLQGTIPASDGSATTDTDDSAHGDRVRHPDAGVADTGRSSTDGPLAAGSRHEVHRSCNHDKNIPSCRIAAATQMHIRRRQDAAARPRATSTDVHDASMRSETRGSHDRRDVVAGNRGSTRAANSHDTRRPRPPRQRTQTAVMFGLRFRLVAISHVPRRGTGRTVGDAMASRFSGIAPTRTANWGTSIRNHRNRRCERAVLHDAPLRKRPARIFTGSDSR